MLVIGNDVVAQVLTMGDTIAALEDSYRDLASGAGVCRPRIDMRIPTSDPEKTYQWGTMEGGCAGGYFAIRMKSDVVSKRTYNGATTEEKYSSRPGLYCGLVLLTSVETGEPLAFLNDGVLQHMRVGADGAIGAKYVAKAETPVLGMLGSGGMARSNLEALLCVRKIRRLQVYSPTRANREAFASEARERFGLDAVAVDEPAQVYRGADIVAAATDSTVPVLDGRLLEPGAHIINIGAGGHPDAASLARVDVYLRFGTTPPPRERPDLTLDDEHLTWGVGKAHKAKRGIALPDKLVYLSQLLDGSRPGRTSDAQISWSERGNLQGAQFHAVAARIYERARARGLGREIPTDWFLQDIRD